jgi:hypothetical protein
MVDPFLVAQGYVDAPVPRHSEKLLAELDAELVQASAVPDRRIGR